MADGYTRWIWRLVVAVGTPLILGLAYLVFRGSPLVDAGRYAARLGVLYEPAFVDLPVALLLGFVAIFFWLPACRVLKLYGLNILAFILLVGAVSGWVAGVLVDGPLVCALAKIGAPFDIRSLTADEMDMLGWSKAEIKALARKGAIEACAWDPRLVSRLALRGALGAAYWSLIYWSVAVRDTKVYTRRL